MLTLGAGHDARYVLIDAGLSPRRTAGHLGRLGLGLEDVSDVLLTHIDQDHFHPGWLGGRASRLGWTWRATRRHLRQARAAGLSSRSAAPFAARGCFELSPDTRIETFSLPHDELGTTGFVIDHGTARLAFATDLGRVPRSLLAGFDRLDALALESNYDPALQVSSPRPEMLKRRIMGGLGHLSNEQSLDAVLEVSGRSDLRHVVLLHLSRQCNDPRIVRDLYARRAPHLVGRLTITSQFRPTAVLHVGPRTAGPARAGRQLDFLESLPGP